MHGELAPGGAVALDARAARADSSPTAVSSSRKLVGDRRLHRLEVARGGVVGRDVRAEARCARSSRGRTAGRSTGSGLCASPRRRCSRSSVSAAGTAATTSKPSSVSPARSRPARHLGDHHVADVARVAQPQQHAVGDLAGEAQHRGGEGRDVDRQLPGAGRGRTGESPSATSRPRGGSSPRRIARTIDTYSRISATGRSIVCPCQPSTTGRCETPSPSVRRPPESSSIVAAVCAIVAGVRV